MTKLFSALLAGALTIALTPAATAQAWASVQVPDQIVVRDTGAVLTSVHVTVLQSRWQDEEMPPLSLVQMRAGQAPLLWEARAELYDFAYGWNPRLSTRFHPYNGVAEAIREIAPWRGYLPEQPPEGTSDRVYEDLMLSLSIPHNLRWIGQGNAWGAEIAAVGAFDDNGVQSPNPIPDGWVVTGECLGTGTIWHGDMGFYQCVDGYTMQPLIEPPRRPHHP